MVNMVNMGTITRHCLLSRHFYTIAKTDSLLCRHVCACMEAENTLAHAVIKCTDVTQIRIEILGISRFYTDVFNRPRFVINFKGTRASCNKHKRPS